MCPVVAGNRVNRNGSKPAFRFFDTSTHIIFTKLMLMSRIPLRELSVGAAASRRQLFQHRMSHMDFIIAGEKFIAPNSNLFTKDIRIGIKTLSGSGFGIRAIIYHCCGSAYGFKGKDTCHHVLYTIVVLHVYCKQTDSEQTCPRSYASKLMY